MSDFIPFVYTQKDCELIKRFYPDSSIVRVSLEGAGNLAQRLPAASQRWLDPAIDGMHRWPDWTPQYEAYLSRFNDFGRLGDPLFQAKPQSEVVDQCVSAVLDECVRHAPAWLSIPQLPIWDGSRRNKINRCLAASTRKWKLARNYKGKLILPVIFTHQKQLHLRAQTNKRIEQAISCYDLAGANGIWIVESSLADQEGSTTFERTRFPDLVSFHQQLGQTAAGTSISVAGPYWGMNLVVWARGLVRHPAIGIGNSYQYHLPGGVLTSGKTRIALPPLRRWAIASSQLGDWLRQAIKQLPEGDKAHIQLAEISRDFNRISLDGRPQVAKYYKDWLDEIASVPEKGRALALYHDFSSAYVIGKRLPDLPPGEQTARKPYRVAKQFMDNCL